MKRKAKVKTAEYLTKRDLIVWTLVYLDDEEEQTYAWPSSDYLKSVGINPETAKVTPDQLQTHCKEMINKEVNFEVQGKPNTAIDDSETENSLKINIREMERESLSYCNEVMEAAEELQSGRIEDDLSDRYRKILRKNNET